MSTIGHQSNPALAFTGLEREDSVVIGPTFDETGNSTIVGEIPRGGAIPGSLLATTEALFVENVS